MRPAERIKSFFNNSKIAVSPEVNDRLINDTMAGFENSKSAKPTKSRPSAWRIIMKSRVARIAVAAVVITVAMFVVHDMGGSIDGATAAFAEMTKAIKQVQWMHIMQYSEDAAQEQPGHNLVWEQWLSYPAGIYASIMSDGSMTYVDRHQHKWFGYRLHSNAVSVRYWHPDSISVNSKLLSELQPDNFFDHWLQKANDPTAQITHSSETYQGKTANVLKVQTGDVNSSREFRFITDPQTGLPWTIEITYTRTKDGERLCGFSYVEVSYPNQGPESIYALGLSRDIPTELDADIPDDDAVRVWEKYRVFEKDFYDVTDRYIVITTASGRAERDGVWTDGRNDVHVEYKDNPRCSSYHYVLGEDLNPPDACKTIDELPRTFEGLLHWSKTVKMFPYYGGKRVYRISRESSIGPTKLERYAWPMHSVEGGRIIEDDYSVANGLICVCIELTQRCSPPDLRNLYYLDPEKDYICQRETSERKSRPGRFHIRDIVEYGRTDAGKWYPRKLVWRGYEADEITSESIIDIYLRTDFEFSDDVFDENIDKPEYPPDVVCP